MIEKTNINQAEFRPGRTLTAIAGVGAVAATAYLALPRGEQTPAPQPETYTEKAQDAAQQPYNPSTDTLVVGNIKVHPRNPNRNTPSEAVLGNSEVKTYVVNNGDESSSLTASSMALPQAESFAVVTRDIDHDGDPDAVAVQMH